MPAIRRLDLFITAWVMTRWDALADRSTREEGDINAWVMVAIMTAALVVFLLSVAKTPLQTAFTNAISKVTGAS